MSSVASQLESLLSYSVKPMKYKALRKAIGCNETDFHAAVQVLKERFNHEQSGIQLIDHDDQLQFVTSPENAQLIEQVFAAEMSGELTKPALETLTIIAYRGPITKPELELIRGVNCSLILRNLMMRGLVTEEKEEKELLPKYQAALEFLQFLGVNSVKELPEYENLSSNELLDELLKQRAEDQQ